MATVIPTAGEPRFVNPANGFAFTLAELQTIVGGYLEALRVPLPLAGDGPLWMFLNEDGKRLGLAVNRFATVIMSSVLGGGDVIVGDVIVCDAREAGEEADGAPVSDYSVTRYSRCNL
jgi:hypothetical protein